MAKKLRDSAYVNDLVIYRNACEEKKLKFTLSQLENLKSIYARQKEQEKMFFAVQHMAVPIKTNSVIMNLRKNLDLEEKKRTQLPSALKENKESLSSAGTTASTYSRVTFRDEMQIAKSPANSSYDAKANSGIDSLPESPIVPKTARKISRPSWSQPVQQKFRHLGTPGINSNNIKSNPRSSIRVISPHPKRVKEGNSGSSSLSTGTKRMPYVGESAALSSPFDEKGKVEQPFDENDDIDVEHESTGNSSREHSSSLLESLETKISERLSNTWSRDAAARKNTFVPRLSDLPPVNINIYENPCSEKESKEKWQKLVYNLRNSSIEETRTEAELARYNQGIRRKWQNTYDQIKRDRISAMVKDKMKMAEGEQLTLVKFLPKSRQSLFIKEAQRSQHKV